MACCHALQAVLCGGDEGQATGTVGRSHLSAAETTPRSVLCF
jgi:hypothetical protein